MLQTMVLTVLFALSSTLAFCDGAQGTAQQPARDLFNLEVEDLLNVKVTTASKKVQRLSEVAAAIYVVTQEDIRHSGATNIPDLLRMVPGVNVAQIDANKWAVSIRGFNGLYANKLLVLVDGRSVYDPSFSGVFWSSQDVMLEDIEHIEVIRGPGGSLWGANAVNGIINIITKNAKDTQGNLLTAGGGNLETASTTFRHGGKMGADGYYRLYGKYANRADRTDQTGAPSVDGWDTERGGFRFDWGQSSPNRFMVQGEIHHDDLGTRAIYPILTAPFTQKVDTRFPAEGWHLLGRWERQRPSGSSTTLQAYCDRSKTDLPEVHLASDTFDLDYQEVSAPGHRHSVVWGLGYRNTALNTQAGTIISYNPPDRDANLFSAFAQDEIRLKKDLHLTLGSKLEHNDFSGFEVQPNVRMAWTPSPSRTLWASVSRAVRTPTPTEQNYRYSIQAFPGQNGAPTLVAAFGNPAFRSETVVANEIGYRVESNERFSTDIAAFYNQYDNLWTFEPGSPFLEVNPSPPHGVVPLNSANKMQATTYGLEIESRWKATKRWKLAFGYSWLVERLDLSGSQDPSGINYVGLLRGTSPRNQFQVRSQMDLRNGLELDTTFYYVDHLPAGSTPLQPGNISPLLRLDARLGWKSRGGVEVSLAAQNLFNQRSLEFGSSSGELNSRPERSFYGKVSYHF